MKMHRNKNGKGGRNKGIKKSIIIQTQQTLVAIYESIDRTKVGIQVGTITYSSFNIRR